MRVANRAAHLGPDAEAAIGLFNHIFLRDRLIEARPARAGFELRLRIEQHRVAADAAIKTIGVVIGVLARAWTLRALMARDIELLGR